jgi:hypothetical protein
MIFQKHSNNKMDFDKYYELQAKQGFPVYQGKAYMRGYGFGSVFKKFFRWIMPIMKENALPVVKNIGKEALKTAVNIANDTLDGQSFAESAKSNLKKSLNTLTNQFGGSKKKILTSAAQKKQKKLIMAARNKNLKTKKTRSLDIFD